MPRRKKEKKPKVSKAQIDVLCTFFEENPELVVGYKITSKNLKAVMSKWQKITPHLNSLGIQKTPSDWAKYLRCHKAGLKQRRFKWRQNRDGSGPIICNADDFSEIGFRMLQVFRKDSNQPSRFNKIDSQNSSTSYMNTEDNVKAEKKYELETIIVKQETNNDSDSNHAEGNEITQVAPAQIFINPNEETPQVLVNSNNLSDEFDTFARNIAQQLRALPSDIALETQEILRCALYKNSLKLLNDVGDPLDKKNS